MKFLTFYRIVLALVGISLKQARLLWSLSFHYGAVLQQIPSLPNEQGNEWAGEDALNAIIMNQSLLDGHGIRCSYI